MRDEKDLELIKDFKNKVGKTLAKGGEKVEFLLNDGFGGFRIPEAVYEELGMEWNGLGDSFEKDRANPKLVALFKEKPELFKETTYLESLSIEEVLTSTLSEYDGMERVSKVFDDFPLIDYLLGGRK